MSNAQEVPNTGRSILAVFAGALVGVILSIATDKLMPGAGHFTILGQPMSDRLFLVATGYRTLYGILGSYIAARLAPSRPMLHAMVLGLIGLAATFAGLVATWNKGPEFGPHWYPLSLVVLTLPQSWLRGKLRLLQLR